MLSKLPIQLRQLRNYSCTNAQNLYLLFRSNFRWQFLQKKHKSFTCRQSKTSKPLSIKPICADCLYYPNFNAQSHIARGRLCTQQYVVFVFHSTRVLKKSFLERRSSRLQFYILCFRYPRQHSVSFTRCRVCLSTAQIGVVIDRKQRGDKERGYLRGT